MAVDGTLEIELNGEHLSTAYRPPFFSMGRWVRRLYTDDGGRDSVVLRLPFQAAHPEFDTDIAPYGLVHGRLSVPGQGTFEATASPTRIRTFDPIRERLQRATGHRFLPEERTGDGRR